MATLADIQAQEGMDVVNAQGDKIGEVSSIQGDEVIVSVGGWFGFVAARHTCNSETVVCR